MSRRKQLFFLLAVMAQLAILAIFPLEKAYIRASGETIFLALQPVDPYDVLSGHYQTLRYTIGDPPVPGVSQGDTIFTVVRRGEEGVWRAVSVTSELPQELGADEAVLRGELQDGRLRYGIETFFFPEKDKERLNRLFAGRLEDLRAEVRVTEGGRAALIGLRVGDLPLEEFMRQAP